jgi:hypothetical protein
MLSRLLWRNPFDRIASVLNAIEQTSLPLTPPDDDVERLSQTDALPTDSLKQSGYSMAFLSHTAKDEPVIRARVLNAVKPFFAETFLMNIGMGTRSPEIVDAYRRRILTALSKSGWFIVALSGASSDSKWVGFEFGWALRYRNHKRILALILEDDARQAYKHVLRFVRTIDATSTSPLVETGIERALRRSGAKKVG